MGIRIKAQKMLSLDQEVTQAKGGYKQEVEEFKKSICRGIGITRRYTRTLSDT